MKAKDLVLWSLLAWLWGSSFLAIAIGVESVEPFPLVAGRMLIGAFLLLAVLYARGGTLRLGARGWSVAVVVGTTGNVVPFLLISFAGQSVDSGLAALIMGIAPVVTLTLAPLVHAGETLSRLTILGAAIGFCGISVLVGPEAFYGLGGDLVPQLLLVGAALCYAFTALFSRRFPFANALQMAAASVLVGALATSVIAVLQMGGSPVPAPSTRSLIALVYLGIGPTALAALIYFQLIPRIGAGRVQQVNYIVPVLGILLGALVLNEQPEWNALVAIPMIVLAVYLVTRRSGEAPKPCVIGTR